MSEVKDPKIKLFGKTIELPENLAAADGSGEPCSARSCEPAVGDSSNQDPVCSSASMLEDSNFSIGDAEEQEPLKIHKTLSVLKPDHAKEETQAEPLTPKESKDSNTTQPTITDSNAPSNSDASMKTSKTEEDQTESTSNNNSNEKALKKPDKIVPCPRCNSMDTKFCYFNNYNVNQPRHFCKNCQRYWTAGGTMRNVPVGAGRRRNKNSVSQFRHLTVPEALNTNGIHHHPNTAVLTFGSGSPMCESIASVLNISKNGPRKPEQLEISVSHGITEGGDDHMVEVGGITTLPEPMPICNPFPYPGPHWPYPWNHLQWGLAGSFPMPFYSTGPPYWGWNVPWVIPPAGPAHLASGPNSRTLGKHSREDDIGLKENSKEEEMVKESNPDKFLWVPKTLRIDDPGEAAKSSIWTTLGIKNDGVDSGSGLFKAFRTESKGDEKAHVPESFTVLQANPAALSRSLNS